MFEFVTNYDEIYKYMSDPWAVKHGLFDDSPPPELFFISSNIKVVKAGEYGAFILDEQQGGVYIVHLAFNDKAKGNATRICTDALKWADTNLNDWQMLLAQIPEYNIQVERLAGRMGFTFLGYDLLEIKKDDKYHKIKNYVLIKGM